MKVAILGASPKSHRYSHKALVALQQAGHKVWLVTPVYQEIDGIKTYAKLGELTERVHTLTVYLNQEHSDEMMEEILSYAPKRVIFNPGAENHLLEEKLKEEGVETLQACTMVMLSTGQF